MTISENRVSASAMQAIFHLRPTRMVMVMDSITPSVQPNHTMKEIRDTAAPQKCHGPAVSEYLRDVQQGRAMVARASVE